MVVGEIKLKMSSPNLEHNMDKSKRLRGSNILTNGNKSSSTKNTHDRWQLATGNLGEAGLETSTKFSIKENYWVTHGHTWTLDRP